VTPEFLSAVVDTLLPRNDGSPPLPSGTAAGVAAGEEHVAVLQAIADAVRGEDAFTNADTATRIAAVRRVEGEMRGPFQALVSQLLQDYYETEAVLLAMGWRAEPPQPRGHVLPPFDETLLDPVKRRGPTWR
jgi:hypothetical protein